MNRYKVIATLVELANLKNNMDIAVALLQAASIIEASPRWRATKFPPKKSGEYLVVIDDERQVARYDIDNNIWYSKTTIIQPKSWCPLPDKPKER